MFDKEAIEALQYGGGINEASSAVRDAYGTTNLVSLPDNFNLVDLEKYLPNRRRARGSMETSNIKAFATYVTLHMQVGTTVFVSHKSMVANAVLNLGTPFAPGHADDRAQLKPDMTAAYAALRQVAQGQALDQARVAEFMEDWPGCITCYNEAGELSHKHAIAAVRNITIEGLRKVEASVEQLSATKSTFEAVTATGKEPLPTFIYFACEPYHGFESRTFVMRVGIRTNDKPALTLRIVNAELHEEEMAQELCQKVSDAIGDTCPVLVGDYTAK